MYFTIVSKVRGLWCRAAGASRVNYTAGAVLSWHMWHRGEHPTVFVVTHRAMSLNMRCNITLLGPVSVKVQLSRISN